jgi:hypothetical protein
MVTSSFSERFSDSVLFGNMRRSFQYFLQWPSVLRLQLPVTGRISAKASPFPAKWREFSFFSRYLILPPRDPAEFRWRKAQLAAFMIEINCSFIKAHPFTICLNAA